MSDNENQEGSVRRSSRQPVPTSKGIWWQLDTLEKNLKKTLSTWKSCCNKIEVLLSDSTDCVDIRNNRDILTERADHVTSVYQQLTRLIEKECQTGEHAELAKDIENDIAKRYEACETSYSDMMRRISRRLTELEDNKSERASRRSGQSSCGKSSRHSQRSNRSIRSEAAVKAAELKTKLKFLDMEAKAQLELEKIKTMRELEAAEAQLDVLDKECQKSDLDDLQRSLPDADILDRFINQVNPEMKENDDVHDTAAKVDRQTTEPKSTIPVHVRFDSDVRQSAPLVPKPCQETYVASVDQSAYGPSKHHESVASSSLPTESSTFLNPSAKTFTPRNSNSPRYTDQNFQIEDLAKSFAEQVSLSRLPPPEPFVFHGDPLKYPAWKASFLTLIEQRQIPSCERIHYLRRYLSESVRDVIENLFLLSSENAYNEAKSLLDQRYGDSFVIANAFRDKLDNWPKVAGRDSLGLRKFSDFTKQCYAAMQSIGTLNVLNDDRENRKLLAKLPDWIVTRWARIVSQHKEEHKQFPSFKVFVDFIEKEAKIACDPVTSVQSLNHDRSPIKSRFTGPRGSRFQARTLSTDTTPKSTTLATTNNLNRKNCKLCNASHDLDICKDFNAKTIEERKEFAKKNRLCFGCLGTDHTSRKCRYRKTCKICSKQHPTSLHGDYQIWQSKEAATTNRHVNTQEKVVNREVQTGIAHLNSLDMGSKSSMIVPVYVSHSDNPNHEQLVYALLDTQSDTTFILENTCQKLGLKGTKVNLSLSTMHRENELIESYKIKGLSIRGFNQSTKIELPTTFTRDIMPANKSHIPTASMAKRWTHLESIAEKIPPIQDCEVGLLIGYNCPRALTPREVIPCSGNGPYGLKTDLGWSIVGIVDTTIDSDLDKIGLSHRVMILETPSNVDESSDQVYFSMRSRVKEVINPHEFTRMFELDFAEHKYQDDKRISREDQRFLETLSEGIHVTNGHYEMPLPFKRGLPAMNNNKELALQRFRHLERKLRKNTQYADDYVAFITDMIQKGFAERVPDEELNQQNGQEWYIPHHGVYHPHKPGKLRVVFDCSAKYQGQALNDYLLQGPDLTNTLVGVLCRFRKEPIAFVCDVEQMFHQFKVNIEHRNYLRFLWYENSDITRHPVEYRMTVHLFGATSSPGCANFGLKQMANDNETQYGSQVANFVRRDFYVDDGLKSLPTVDEALEMIGKGIKMCRQGGLRLHKFLSNSKDVLAKIPEEDRAKGLNLDISDGKLPVTKTLGIEWCAESDVFKFRITLDNKPLTRRGMLSTLNSVYDPLGIISPIVLAGKKLLQLTCQDQTDWDSPLPEIINIKWEKWKRDLLDLNEITINRCIKPDDFGNVKSVQLHHFSDASSSGYGQCSYIRLVNDDQRVYCSLLMGKARVAPLRPTTIPRLELTAAVVSISVSSMLRKELEYDNIEEHFWCDSKVVLGYIANDSRRFHVFVANRVEKIRQSSEPSQWHYVTSAENPADIASRGATPQEFKSSNWFTGPEFLWDFTPTNECEASENLSDLSENDPEVRKGTVLSTKLTTVDFATLAERLKYFSDWKRAKIAVARCLKYRDILRKKVRNEPLPSNQITVDDIKEAEMEILKSVQKSAFKVEMDKLRSLRSEENNDDRQFAKSRNATLKQTSSLYKLDPFLDSNGIIRVGGRIKRSNLDSSFKHPVILPRDSHLTNLVIRYVHKSVQHQGRGITINEIRSQGFWIIGCSSAVSKFITRCVVCRKLRGTTQVQKMADLPSDRLEAVPPFTYCAVDLFGPFLIKEGRKELKRYGVLFTCLASRAVHLESANSLDTSSYINALRRFISIRGPVRLMRSDQGSNFVGAKREMKEAFSEMDAKRISQYLLDNNCDYVECKMNVPSASHMGGVWERQIRSIRSVLNTLLVQLGSQLDDESLRTFLCEAASIVNSRPLTQENLNDPLSDGPLTPNHLLTMKSNIILPPPGEFSHGDLYSRKRWRRTQYLANQFWDRWRKEYLSNLQSRQKWISKNRNMCAGDVVIIKDENLTRNEWRLGRLVKTYVDEDGLVRKARIAIGTPKLNNRGIRTVAMTELERPIHKLVLIQETEEFPTEEP